MPKVSQLATQMHQQIDVREKSPKRVQNGAKHITESVTQMGAEIGSKRSTKPGCLRPGADFPIENSYNLLNGEENKERKEKGKQR